MSISTVWEIREQVRARKPLVHNITNYVAINVVANALLALGASPVMAHAAEEVEEIVALADALTVNLGTPTLARATSMQIAVRKAQALGKPWVLDPVGVGLTRWRTAIARNLLHERPTVVRGNASEVVALAGVDRAQTHGVDSSHASEAALLPARELALKQGCVVAVTGAVDIVTDGEQVLRVANGHPLMARVTGLGCCTTAVVGAFVAVHPDPLAATAYALAFFGLAGEVAAERSAGPGSFEVQLLDALYGLDHATVTARAQIQ